MGKVDELNAKYRAERLSDPHGWAERMERDVNARSLVGSVAFFLAIALAIGGGYLWRQNSELTERVAVLESMQAAPVNMEHLNDPPPDGFVLVE